MGEEPQTPAHTSLFPPQFFFTLGALKGPRWGQDAWKGRGTRDSRGGAAGRDSPDRMPLPWPGLTSVKHRGPRMHS